MEGEELKSVIGPSLIRLASGGLCLVHATASLHGAHYQASRRVITCHTSTDEGRTWSVGVEVNPGVGRESTSVDGLLQLVDGRLILPFQRTIGPTPIEDDPGKARRFGEELSNAFSYNLHCSFCYFSDDEGRSWQASTNETFATMDRGVGGIYSMGEPQIAELADGRLLMLGNTSLGRLFRTYSEDHGETWGEAEPTELVLRRSPLCLKRHPGSGDVLVIWSQISDWEGLAGLYRHRLSTAISQDGGLTWGHHRNLVSLDDVERLEPQPLSYHLLGRAQQPLDRTRYHRAPQPLRNDHPYCAFHDGKAIIVYGHGGLGERAIIEKTYGMDWDAVACQFACEPIPGSSKVKGSNRLHVIPIEGLYQ